MTVACATAPPDLGSDTAPKATHDRLTGDNGVAFLEEVVRHQWEDDGRQAAELLAWIPRDAGSSDRAVATRAGETAHAVASFLADLRESLTDAPANNALWQAFANTLIPYLGALVGDETGVTGFKPLDGPKSPESLMRRTSSLFAAFVKHAEANTALTDAAKERAARYEEAFAKIAVAEPMMADRAEAWQELQRAAQLRGAAAAGPYLVDPESERPIPTLAQTWVAYRVASLTARPGDEHINDEFFAGPRLMSPDEIPESDWSIYDVQLTVYLAPWPRVLDAIRQFGRTYSRIANP